MDPMGKKNKGEHDSDDEEERKRELTQRHFEGQLKLTSMATKYFPRKLGWLQDGPFLPIVINGVIS